MALGEYGGQYAILPIDNPSGSITADITTFPAINRGTEHPDEAVHEARGKSEDQTHQRFVTMRMMLAESWGWRKKVLPEGSIRQLGEPEGKRTR